MISDSRADATLAVVARAPTPGRCKTRLSPRLSPQEAATFYQAMLLDTLDALSEVKCGRRVVLAAPEDDGVARLRELVPAAWEVVSQRGDDLGERLANGMSDLSLPEKALALVSSDAPTLPTSAISAALRSFGRSPRALLGPSEDGGYYLIAMNVLELGVFSGISWSTAIVAEQTRVRLRELALPWDELPIAADIDTPADLDRLRAKLSRQPGLALRCAKLLEIRP